MFLSVIVPVYNVESFIARCLNSLMNQAVRDGDFEIIIVDDGSTDKSLEVIRNLQLKANVHIIEQLNYGVGIARNKGLEFARGEYIWFVDSDDFVEANFLSKAIPFLKKNKVDVLSFSFQCCDEYGNKIDWIRNRHEFSGILSGDDYYLHSYRDSYLWAHFYKRSLLGNYNIRFRPIRFMQDSEFIPRVLLHAKKVAYLNETGVNYVKRTSSITNGAIRDTRKIEAVIQVFINLMELKNGLVNNSVMKNALRKKLHVVRVIIFSLFLFERYKNEDSRQIASLLRDKGILPMGILYRGFKPYQCVYNVLGLLMSISPYHIKRIHNYVMLR